MVYLFFFACRWKKYEAKIPWLTGTRKKKCRRYQPFPRQQRSVYANRKLWTKQDTTATHQYLEIRPVLVGPGYRVQCCDSRTRYNRGKNLSPHGAVSLLTEQETKKKRSTIFLMSISHLLTEQETEKRRKNKKNSYHMFPPCFFFISLCLLFPTHCTDLMSLLLHITQIPKNTDAVMTSKGRMNGIIAVWNNQIHDSWDPIARNRVEKLLPSFCAKLPCILPGVRVPRVQRWKTKPRAHSYGRKQMN